MKYEANYISQHTSVGFSQLPDHLRDSSADGFFQIGLAYLHACLDLGLFALQMSMSSCLILQPLLSTLHLNTHALACGICRLDSGFYLFENNADQLLETLLLLAMCSSCSHSG